MRAAAILGLCILPACGPAADTSGDSHFIPLQKDFAGYRQWRVFDLGDGVKDTVHPAGRRIIYLNRTPPSGAAGFPVGTILVKTVTPDDGSPPSVFAMAKRGGTYNSQGALGWEWFELQDGSDGTALIVWRGIAPPAGEGYGDIAGGACNTCHGVHADNDYVASVALLVTGL